MATWPRQHLELVAHDAVMLELLTRMVPEGASQTFLDGAPLKIASGLYVEWVSPSDADLAAFAREDGHNASGKRVSVVLAEDGLEIEANFLGSAAAANTLAATDYGISRDLAAANNLVGSERGWYIQDSSSAVAVRISEFRTNHPLPEVQNDVPVAGDIDVRLRAKPLATILHWYD